MVVSDEELDCMHMCGHVHIMHKCIAIDTLSKQLANVQND